MGHVNGVERTYHRIVEFTVLLIAAMRRYAPHLNVRSVEIRRLYAGQPMMHNYGVDINTCIAVSNVVIAVTGHFEMNNSIAVKYLMESTHSNGDRNCHSRCYRVTWDT